MKTFRMIGMALVAILISVSLVSCSDDDEEKPVELTYDELIIGTWETDWDEKYTFREDKTVTMHDLDIDYTAEGTWVISGDTLTMKLAYVQDDGSTFMRTLKETITVLRDYIMITYDKYDFETVYTRIWGE